MMTLAGSKVILAAQAPAGLAGAVNAVEGKGARLERRNVDAALDARPFLRVEVFLAVDHGHLHDALGQFHRGFDRGGQPALDARLEQQPVHDHFDGVIAPPVERNFLVEVVELLVHAHAHETLARQLLEELAEFTLPPAHDGRQDHDALAIVAVAVVAVFASAMMEATICSVVWREIGRPHRVAVRHADRGVEQAQVIVNFGNGAHRRARAAAGGLLFDGDGGAQAFDGVHVRAAPSGRGTGARRRRASGRSGAGLRRR